MFGALETVSIGLLTRNGIKTFFVECFALSINELVKLALIFANAI